MYEIKKGIPIPAPKLLNGGRPSEYPFDKMAPGDMIEVQPKPGETLAKCAQRMRTASGSWRGRNAHKLSFVVRERDENGDTFLDSDLGLHEVVRVWATPPRPPVKRKAK